MFELSMEENKTRETIYRQWSEDERDRRRNAWSVRDLCEYFQRSVKMADRLQNRDRGRTRKRNK